VSPLALQLREAQEVPDVEPLTPNTNELENLKILVAKLSEEPSLACGFVLPDSASFFI